jgi:hypothetical protein
MRRGVPALAVGWLLVIAVAAIAFEGAELAYRTSGPGCRTLTGIGWSELLQRAIAPQVALTAWTLAAAYLLVREWSRSAADSRVRGAAHASIALMAVVLVAWGIGAWLADWVELERYGALTLAACVAATVVAGLAAAGGPRADRGVASAMWAQAAWVVLAFAAPLLFGGNGEIPEC